MAIRAGRFKARGIAGSAQYGVSGENKTLCITVDVAIAELGQTVGIFLYFSPGSAPFSLERLRAMGWSGKDIRDLSGIESNEVDVEIRQEEWQGKVRWKIDILTAGRAAPGEVIDKDQFAARLQAVIGATPLKGVPADTAGLPSARAPAAGEDEIPF